MQIRQHKLEGDSKFKVEWEPSPNKGGKLENTRPDTVVIHYTAGASARSSVKTLCAKGTRASAHLVIGREGDIYQLVPFDTVAWHAGRSSYKGRSGFNRYSVGIELDNPGQLTPNGSGGFLTWYNKLVAPEKAVRAVHRNQREPSWWHRFKDVQIELTEMICRLLIEKYDIQMILGHEEIAPQRKVDPGPAFPLDKIRTRLLLDDRSEEKPEEKERGLPTDSGIVAAGKLNIRSGPGLSHQTVAKPLEGGELVRIVGEARGWLEVEHTTRGWVKAEFVERTGRK
jgi:N-acetylmuramoyl-L-alanine amidase